MAVGDDATAAGFPLVPDTGQELAKVRYGAQEINRTRDYIAQTKGLFPISKAAFRTSAGISSGTADPSGGSPGDIYFKTLP